MHGVPVLSEESRYSDGVKRALRASLTSQTPFVEALLAHYTPRIANAAEFALRSRVLLVKSPSGSGIDISLGALPFEDLVVERATPFEFAPGLEFRTCSAEDLMVMKLAPLTSATPKALPCAATNARLAFRRRATQSAKEEPRILRNLSGSVASVQRVASTFFSKGVERVSTRHAECVRHVGPNSRAKSDATNLPSLRRVEVNRMTLR